MDKKLDKTVQDLKKRFGEAAIFKLSDMPLEMDRISSGSLVLDLALGGGWPRGRIGEIYGPESAGKSTLTDHLIAEAQKMGLTCAYLDMEHAGDPIYMENVGVNLDSLYVSQPDTGEMCLEIADELIDSGLFGVVVIDSVAALVPRAELEGDMGDSHMGLQARLMSQALRKLSGKVKRTNTILLFVNQIRSKIGVMFGNPETTSGGNALKFYASIRLDIRRIGSNKEATQVVSNQTRVKVKKNKTFPPFKEAEFDIVFGKGIDLESEIIDFGVEQSLIEKSGSWFKYIDPETGEIIAHVQGKTNFQAELKPEHYQQIKSLLTLRL